MVFVRFGVGLAVLVVLVAFYARPNYPEYASHQGLKTVVGLGVKFIAVTSYVGSMFGFSPINITRAMCDVTLLLDKDTDDVKVYERTVDGVEVTIFQPTGESDTLRPGIIHIHGGGWALLSPRNYGPLLREIVRATGAVLVSINYRRPPEFLFPTAIYDCIKAAKYILRNAEEFGIDAEKIAIKGDSAGGNLATAVSLNLTTSSDLPSLKLMALIYPALQLLDFNLPSFKIYANGPGFCDKPTMIAYWLWYAFGNKKYFNLFYNNAHITEEVKRSGLMQYVSKDLLPEEFIEADGDTEAATYPVGINTIPDEVTKVITDPMYAPLMATDDVLAKLPPAYILNAEFDVLRDEGFIFAERLRQNGVPVEHKFWKTEDHGFLNFVDINTNAKKETEEFAKHFLDAVNRV